MGILLAAVWVFIAWFFYGAFTADSAESAERSTPRPAYEYGKLDAYDKANENNAHYQEARPAASFNRFTEERTQLQRSVEEQRKRKDVLKQEERNSYKPQ